MTLNEDENDFSNWFGEQKGGTRFSGNKINIIAKEFQDEDQRAYE